MRVLYAAVADGPTTMPSADGAQGFIRNEQKFDTDIGLIIAFWNGQSRATEHPIESAKRRGIPIDVIGEDSLHPRDRRGPGPHLA